MFTFPKSEKLCSKKCIDYLFANSKSFVVFPYRIVYTELPPELLQDAPATLMVSVAKKRFKRAVKRNLLRRRTKEAYRLNKAQLIDVLTLNNKRLAMAILYLDREEREFENLNEKMVELLDLLTQKMAKQPKTESDELALQNS